MVRKRIAILMAASFMVLISAASFADEKGRAAVLRSRAGNTGGIELMMVQQKNPGRDMGSVDIVGQLAGIDTIHRKFQLKIQRVFLDAKQEALDYFEAQQDLRKKLFDLTSDYESDPERKRSEIIDLLEELRKNQGKLQEIQERSMKRSGPFTSRRERRSKRQWMPRLRN